jgi:hypothetical protein
LLTAESPQFFGYKARKPKQQLSFSGGNAKAEFEAKANKNATRQTKVPNRSSRLVSLFGLMFLGMAIFDDIMQRRDAMTYTFLFFWLSVFGVAYCLQNIEKRLASIEQAQESSPIGDGGSHQEAVKHVLRGLDDVRNGQFSSKVILEIGNENQ